MTVDQAIQLAVQHHQAGRLPDAENLYRQVLAVVPNHPVALHNLGQIAYTVRKYDAAVELLNGSLAAQPNDPNTYNTLGATLFALGRNEESERACRLALQLAPRNAAALANLGNALVGRGDTIAAISAFETAIAIEPNNAIAHDGLGATLLMTGDLQRGWHEWEWRWLKPNYETNRFPNHPRWNGSDLAGKRLLLMVEQGYGDVFQFARYAPLLKARGATVIMEVVPDIHRLMSTLTGVDEWVIAGLQIPQVDLVCPLLSVPLWYRTTLETIPAQVPYLAADARLVESFQSKYFRADPNLKVGLVWAGRPTHPNDHNRTISLALLAPLGEIPGVTFYSLQKGDAAKEIQTAPAGMKMVDLSVGLTDFNWTAAAVAGLDLIITVDTSIAHVSGALAKPVWVLVPFVPDWRWLLNRDDSPWYPTMRLFRQKTLRNWGEAIQRAREELQTQVSNRKLPQMQTDAHG
jgi:Flp pilus assembly protein TadD